MFFPSEEVKQNQPDTSFCNSKKKTEIGNDLEDIGIKLYDKVQGEKEVGKQKEEYQYLEAE